MKRPPRWIQILVLAVLVLWIAVLALLHGYLGRAAVPDGQGILVVSLPRPSVRQDNVRITQPTLTRSHVKPSDNYVQDASDLWEQPTDPPLPDWMKDYFRWHKEQQRQLADAIQAPYLLLTCPQRSKKCGGTVDRLSPLAFLVYIASRTHRRLLIHWGRPAALEEFLLPPMNGIDWRFDTKRENTDDGRLVTTLETLLEAAAANDRAVKCRYQAPDHGAAFYDQHQGMGEPTMAQITRTVWNIFFTPTPPVARRIEQFLVQQHLVPGHYLATHIRALYAVKTQDPYVVQYWANNAINCTSHLAQGSENSIFVASDASFATKIAQRYGSLFGWNVVYHSANVGQEPLHLDKAINWQNRPPSDFYDAFVDLYLLGLARCVTYGVGGYGRFAAWLTGNLQCALQHHNATAIRECSLASPPNAKQYSPSISSGPIFRQPMETENMNHFRSSINSVQTETIFDSRKGLPTFPDIKRQPPLANLWEASTVLPPWMKEYFAWHRDQRKLMHETNWQDFRYLVVECTNTGTKCGGTSDRLRPVPYYVRLAAETKRVLFIYWTKPQKLETFLLPPVGGMDWRLPVWMVKFLSNKTYITVATLAGAAARKDVLIQARVQAHDHGSHYYDNSTTVLDGETPMAFRRHYHDCWYVVFTPAPALAELIENELVISGLTPGQYGVAHVRALYGIETTGRDATVVASWTKNAINCLSKLRSGPYFLASDSEEARRVALSYGHERNVHIFARVDAPEPIHMDIATEGDDLTRLFDVFVDLYLMSFGRCFSYNVGGFAKWAQLISGQDFTRNIRHWTRGVDKKSAFKDCAWNESAIVVSSASAREPSRGMARGPLFLPPA